MDLDALAATVEVDGLVLRYVATGPADGPPVLLLHGFPDSLHLWRHQVPVLADAGFRVVAPDLPGFGESSRPTDVERYHLLRLLGDMTGLLDALGIAHAHVVGHDWGAALAWTLGIGAPDRVDRLVALSVGHPSAFARAGVEQMEKSWYMLAFQHEGTAEDWLSRDDWVNARAWARGGDQERWIADLSRPGALTAALAYYRANVPPASFLGPPVDLPAVAADTLGVWSSDDMALTEAQMVASRDWVDGAWRYERIEDVSHWIPVDAPETLNRLLLDWLPGA